MKINYLIAIALAVFSYGKLNAEEKSREEILKEESRAILENSLKIAAQFYTLEEGEELREITQAVLQSRETRDHIKERILTSGRRIFLFTYPSDGFQVKGYISFVPNPSENPLLIFLRGGNRLLGLMNPASTYSCMRNYTVLGTAYRGGVSEGEDKFGGDEVNDVQNLVEYLPTLAQKLELQLHPKSVFILAGSRGGMEMFLSLAKSPALQQYVSKAASLSGLLDIQECMRYRPDMRKMFIRDFGLVPGENEEQWTARRNPLLAVPKIRKDLPFLILQGTEDLRTSLNEGIHMVEKLRENGNPVDYLEIAGGDHCLSNQPDCLKWIADWFEK
ncbi:MAG TPA: prolyl oligopeptidase family serine peptidase [Rhabdochlamydiaceae bacterium]